MAQLSDDCFAFGGPLLSLDAALEIIATRIPPVAGIESVALDRADGRILAEDLVARAALPPFDNSAVDGWAVRFGDLTPPDLTPPCLTPPGLTPPRLTPPGLATSGETVLPQGGRIAAGASASGIDGAGVAVRIFTGAPMPAGADTVFMQEDVVLRDGAVVLPTGLKQGANRRLAGEDVAAGDVALAAGRRLQPQDVALAAALGETWLAVRRPLAVALFSTGDELREPGEALAEGAIHDSNRVAVAALLRRLGTAVHDGGILPDDPATVSARLAEAARSHDLIVTSGGVSSGEEDHVKAAVERAGSLVFWRLGIKPGRPVAMGIIEGTPFVGLPGNPVAVFVTFCFLVRPLLARLAGAAAERPLGLPIRAGFRYSKKGGRREYVRVSLRQGADGTVEAVKYRRDGAGVISSLTRTDGLAELAETVTSVAVGDTVAFYPYAALC